MKSTDIKRKRHIRKIFVEVCKICGVVIKSSTLLSDHMKRCHLKQKDFKCNFCSLTFVYPYELKRHSYIHTGERPYACSLCSKVFSQRVARNWHEDNHRVIKHKCQLCDKIFYNRQERRVHEKKVHSRLTIDKLQCTECRKRFATKEILRVHLKEHNISLKCSHCPLMFSKTLECKLHEQEHVREKNSKDPSLFENRPKRPWNKKWSKGMPVPHKCQICKETFTYQKQLYTHFNVMHPGQKDKLAKLPCQDCNKTFPTAQHLYQHRVVHATEKKFTCSRCNYKTARSGDLRVHIINRHTLPTLECMYCEKKFKHKRTFEAHVNMHENKKTFKCKFCPKTYFSSVAVRKHALIHAEQCICSLCGMQCSKPKIGDHLFKHHEELLIVKSEGKEEPLMNFFQECSEVAPNMCESTLCKLCGKKLRNRRLFLVHLSSHGEDEASYMAARSWFECYVCGKVFDTSREMESHSSDHDTEILSSFLSKKKFWWLGSNFRNNVGLGFHKSFVT